MNEVKVMVDDRFVVIVVYQVGQVFSQVQVMMVCCNCEVQFW